MSAGNVVPAGALDKHIAILGKTGSGKSNLAKTIAEDLLARGARVSTITNTERRATALDPESSPASAAAQCLPQAEDDRICS